MLGAPMPVNIGRRDRGRDVGDARRLDRNVARLAPDAEGVGEDEGDSRAEGEQERRR